MSVTGVTVLPDDYVHILDVCGIQRIPPMSLETQPRFSRVNSSDKVVVGM